MTRVLVTGGSGTLGLNLLEQLAGYEVLAPVRNPQSAALDALRGRVAFAALDLLDAEATAVLLASFRPAIVVHCAAVGLRPPKGSAEELKSRNVATTLNLFDGCCRLSAPPRFVHISSGMAYRDQGRALAEADPLTSEHPYGGSKAASEAALIAAVSAHRLPVTILRPFAFTGRHDGGQRLFPLILEAARKGVRQTLSPCTQVRDYCAVGDVAEAIVHAMAYTQRQPVECFNVGSGAALTLRDLLIGVGEQLSLPIELGFGDLPANPLEPQFSVADLTHTTRFLGWRPKTNLAYAVWELAQQIAPSLELRKPGRDFGKL